VGTRLAATWYTYDEDGAPVWYQAVGSDANPWRGELQRYRWDASTRAARGEPVGELVLRFASARRLQFEWRLGDRRGSEAMQPLLDPVLPAAPDRTGIYFDAREPGWGLSVYSAGDVRGALMYFYDASGSARWALGLGDNRRAEERLAMQAFDGFCPHCARSEVRAREAGSLAWRFGPERGFSLDTEVGEGERWRREGASMAPLSEAYRDPRWR
jgi:hypothetical protein